MLRAAITKDVQLLLRDRGALASLFLLPIIFVSVFGFMFRGGGDQEQARLLPVWHAPEDPRAAAVVAAIERSGAFRVRRDDSPERVRAAIAAEDAAAGLILPQGFDPAAGAPAELVIDEAASPRLRGPIEGALRGIIQAALRGDHPAEARPVLEARSPPGIEPPLPDVDGFQISVPGNAILFGFFIALTCALSFVDERHTGTWRRLLAAPVRRPVLLCAKLVPYFLVGLCQMAFLFGLGALAFGMRVGGSVAALVALTGAVVFCATALGLLIASFGGTQKQIGGVGSICLLVMGLLGGAMVPRVIMPEAMQRIGLITPHAWALDGYFDVLVRDGTGLADIAPQILAVAAFGVVFAAAGALRFKFER